jgi:hypothetical protein
VNPELLNYTNLSKRTEFLPRFRYLSIGAQVGAKTFGYDRHLNQGFYGSYAWRQVRDLVLIRDDGCDLGVPGHEIHDRVYVHHMNPIQVQDLTDFNPDILNPEYLICVSHQTHNAIHFSDEKQLPRLFVEREPGDTTLG